MSIYKSTTHGPIPISETARRLLQHLRDAMVNAISDRNFLADNSQLSKTRGEIALHISKLEAAVDANGPRVKRLEADLYAAFQRVARHEQERDDLQRQLSFDDRGLPRNYADRFTATIAQVQQEKDVLLAELGFLKDKSATQTRTIERLQAGLRDAHIEKNQVQNALRDEVVERNELDRQLTQHLANSAAGKGSRLYQGAVAKASTPVHIACPTGETPEVSGDGYAKAARIAWHIACPAGGSVVVEGDKVTVSRP